MQSQRNHGRRALRKILLATSVSGVVMMSGASPAVAGVTTGPSTPGSGAPTVATTIEPFPAPPSNILQLALPLILAQDAREAASEQAQPAADAENPAAAVTLPRTRTSVLALAGIGGLAVVGGLVFVAVSRRKI